MSEKMLNIDSYMQNLLHLLQIHFPRRIIYLGLQGSYARGEATANSDIDVFLVLDQLSVADLKRYKNLLAAMDCPAQSCGFICGVQELAGWNPGEVCQLLHETKDYYGNLASILPPYTKQDLAKHIKRQVGDIYHQLCHLYLHDRCGCTREDLRQAYKAAFYVLQNKYYLQQNLFILDAHTLLSALSGRDQQIMQLWLMLREDTLVDEAEAYNSIFLWCQEQLHDCRVSGNTSELS